MNIPYKSPKGYSIIKRGDKEDAFYMCFSSTGEQYEGVGNKGLIDILAKVVA